MLDDLASSRLHPLLASRWSPTTFDETHTVTVDDVELLLEAARWAPSAGLLVANLSHRFVEDTDWDYSKFALYDLGQAVTHMTVQARALGLHVRQFRAFDRAAVAAEFAVPRHWEVTTMSAVGRVADATAGADTSSGAPRQRRPVDDLLWTTPEDGAG